MPPASLRELQQWMAARIAPGAAAAPGGQVRLNAQRGAPGEARLAVYAGGYAARMREALAEVYEAVRHVLGDRAFAELSQAYAAQPPSGDYNLTFAVRGLPGFLASHPLSERLPFLPDLAWLEWLVCLAFHAFEQPPIDPAALAGRPPEAWSRTRLHFQPSVGVAASAWPILDLWQARRQPRAAIDLPVAGRPQAALVFRRGLEVRCALLAPEQRALLGRLLEGCPLGEACAAVTQPERLPLERWFSQWAADGLIVEAR